MHRQRLLRNDGDGDGEAEDDARELLTMPFSSLPESQPWLACSSPDLTTSVVQ